MPPTAQFEGCVLHLYLDSVGVISLGIGHACHTLDDALDVPGANSAEAVKSDWDALTRLRASMQPADFRKHAAAFYAAYTQARWTQDGVMAAFDWDVKRHRREMLPFFPDYATYPASVQAALDDMALNLGPGFAKTWPRFSAAVKSRNWRVAAMECRRPQVGDARNAWTKAQFLQAV